MVQKHFFFCVFTIALLGSISVDAQVAEIPRPFMPGVAKTVVRGGRAVIYYNPIALRRMGPDLGAFVRAHEYGHINLGHFRHNISPRTREAEADWYATQNTSVRSAIAARNWFMAGNGGGVFHGTPRARALRVTNSMRSQPRYPIFRR